MQPQPRLWKHAIGRLLAFGILFFVIGAIIAVPAARFGGATMLSSFWFDVTLTSIMATIAGAIVLRFLDKRPVAALGIGVSSATPRHAAVGIAIGAAGLFAAAAAMFVTGALEYAPDDGSAAQWGATVARDFGFFTVAAYAEEVVFRGYLFQVLVQWIGAPIALFVTSVGFAFAHNDNPNVGAFALLNIALAGVLLGVAYLKTLSLWFATALHMAWNWTMATLLDLPVSGLSMFDTPLYEPEVGGPGWWSGGSFGPEGGLVGTLGFCVALFVLWRWRVVQPDATIAAAGPLVIAAPYAPIETEVENHG
jgi:membrane protease YdiL (CAAX protease family)